MTTLRDSAVGRTRPAAPRRPSTDCSVAQVSRAASLRRVPVERAATLRQRPGFRCSMLRLAFGLSLFAATGAGAGAAGGAHAAAHQPAAAHHAAAVVQAAPHVAR